MGTSPKRANKNGRLALILAGVVVGMVGLSFASVPLYNIFCRVTGFGGTTQIADKDSATVLDRMVTVRFDASVQPDLNWSFKPEQKAIRLKVGETQLAFYEAVNLGDEPVVANAVFNVTPDKAGLYFDKIDCFCFTEQVLQPGQRADMPVSFYIDPEMDQDVKMDGVTTITLSYTFYKAQDQSAAKAARDQAAAGAPGSTDIKG
ncbi:cytochrome c oxidase assembly protein [uncultured Nisaea sp.]|jgi:cytochrome c oxidase assembly protein subunit 11|uniref:cytochrome c oxidase assembly protein n=1 Tax=uncultured Nisaea sp. TaxID=538215 RepID=UPI0030ED2B44|tara:strand:- start:481 stop:1092 length:612 start_codon:yes stop_codon:yes gene_type:complete